jgi:molecular chaperone GrpE (heat shock protein)|tara:strand:- start:467 stop:1282 length:816 start_codon:yes stop_codon:yes gene_type:complete
MSESKSKKPRTVVTHKALPLPVTVPKWSFLFADAIFIGLGYWISTLIQNSAQPWQVVSILVCAVFGAGFAIAPYYLEYKAEAKAMEIAQLTTVVKEVGKMEAVAKQISEASDNWVAVQEASAQTAKFSEEIAEGIQASVKEHDAFMAKASTDELNTLRLEAEKFRRMESDWTKSLVSMLDLIYRLERSAAASGKEQFIKTTGVFQNQCRDVTRRIGLVAFEAEQGVAFDPEMHAVPDGEKAPEGGANIAETRLPGFRLQGRIIRKPLVAVS